MRIIDADALIEDIKEWGFIGETCAIEAVNDAPTIEPKRGEWIIKQKGFGVEAKVCSVCGVEKNNMSNFCPNCGADMRGADDD